MGRRCGDIALYSGIAGGAEAIIVPEIPMNIDKLCENIRENSSKGKTSDIIVVAEGAEKADNLAILIKHLTNCSVRTMVLGHIQRGGSPSNFDRVFAARLGYRAVELLREDVTNRVIGIKDNHIIDVDIMEALNMKSTFDTDLYEIARILSL